MTLQELKKSILNMNTPDTPLVLKCDKSEFVAMEYVNAIASFRELEIRWHDDVDGFVVDSGDNMFDFSDIDYLRVLRVDTLELPDPKAFLGMRNAIVVCHAIGKKTEGALSESGCVVAIPALKDWQVEEYLMARCQGLPSPKAKWLCSVAGHDIGRISNEAGKIACFQKSDQDAVFDAIDSDDGYSDLGRSGAFELSNALLARDAKTVAELLRDTNAEPFALVALLRRGFRNVIGIQMDSGATPSKLGIKPAQFNIVRAKNVGRYTNDELMDKFMFLTGFDYGIKSGNIDLNGNRLLDYVVCGVMS